MKLLVTENHDGWGVFPLFKKGTTINNIKPDDEYKAHAEAIWGSASPEHWVACTIDGHDTFIPNMFITDGALNRDYNPTELVVQAGQTLELLELVFEWLYVRDENGKEGWLPASKVVSI